MKFRTRVLLLVTLVVPQFLGCPYRQMHHPVKQLASIYQEACYESGDIQNVNCEEILDEACRKLINDQESDAEFILTRGISDNPDCFDAEYLLSVIYFQQQRFQDALGVIVEMERNSQIEFPKFKEIKSAISYRFLKDASELFLKSEYQDSISKLKLYKTYFKTDSESLLLEMENYQALGQDQKAIDIFQSFPDKNNSFELLALAGTLYLRSDAFEEAESVLSSAYRLKKDPEVKKQLEIVRVHQLKNSDNQNRIDTIQSPWVTREDLADLLVLHFDVPNDYNRSCLIVDIEESWAKSAIQLCVNTGLMRLSRDHRFFPNRKVRRMDLAIALYNLGSVFGVAFQDKSPRPVDISEDHYAFYPIVWCLKNQTIKHFEDGTFRAGEIPSGEEVIKAIEVVKNLIDESA